MSVKEQLIMKTVTFIQSDAERRRPYLCPAVEQVPSGPCFSLCVSEESDLVDSAEIDNWGNF